MKPSDKAEYKAEVKAALYEYLQKNNLMESKNDEIMPHLQNMYRHLEDKKLIKYGLNWGLFQTYANDAFMFSLLKGAE